MLREAFIKGAKTWVSQNGFSSSFLHEKIRTTNSKDIKTDIFFIFKAIKASIGLKIVIFFDFLMIKKFLVAFLN